MLIQQPKQSDQIICHIDQINYFVLFVSLLWEPKHNLQVVENSQPNVCQSGQTNHMVAIVIFRSFNLILNFEERLANRICKN